MTDFYPLSQWSPGYEMQYSHVLDVQQALLREIFKTTVPRTVVKYGRALTVAAAARNVKTIVWSASPSQFYVL